MMFSPEICSSCVAKIPSAEFEIDVAVIRALLAEQAPHLAHLPLQRAASGWDNEMWRLGTDLAVRLLAERSLDP